MTDASTMQSTASLQLDHKTVRNMMGTHCHDALQRRLQSAAGDTVL